MHRLILRTAVAGLFSIVGCDTTATSSIDSASNGQPNRTGVRLALNWFPECEHGGYYAALVRGYYRDAGLDVEIIPGGKAAPVIPEVATGRVEFGVTNADQILLGRAQGAPVVAIMAAVQDSPRCIMVHASSGIRTLQDLRQLTLAMNDSPFALFLRKRLPLEDVQTVPYSGTIAEFMFRDHFAQQAYVFSEPYVAAAQGADVRCLMVSDAGFNPYTSVLFTSDDAVRTTPDVVQRFVDASIHGWREYLQNPVETNRYIHAQNPEMSLEILAWGADAMKPLCAEDERFDEVGSMTAARWHRLADQLVEIDAIEPASVKVSEAFTLNFLVHKADAAEPHGR